MKNLTDKKSLSDKKVKTYKRRPSFDIARSFVEMNFAVLMAPEMTDKEARHKKVGGEILVEVW